MAQAASKATAGLHFFWSKLDSIVLGVLSNLNFCTIITIFFFFLALGLMKLVFSGLQNKMIGSQRKKLELFENFMGLYMKGGCGGHGSSR